MSEAPASSNFIAQIVREDQASGKHGGRVLTRFPPEPNGYLHIGHAKSICLNFGIAREFAGATNLRFDDTNPAKEDLEYVESIKDDVHWLGFEYQNLRHASDYFEVFYRCAEKLIRQGDAYVDDLSADAVREYRGSLTEAGRESPYRERTPAESLKLFRAMRAGEFQDGARTLRAKIDMGSGNINLRDPAIYRIRKLRHQNTGDAWCIYPMYDYAHCISDAVEGITHSLCTLEFEDHRPLYDWFLDKLDLPNDAELLQPLRDAGITDPVSRPQQIEFARGNLDYTVMSKRKLMQLVQEGLVDGWDDPRMPTLSGARRRGFTPGSLRTFWERAGVTKQNSVIEWSVLENCLREDLDGATPRRLAVLDPIKLVLTNLEPGHEEVLNVPNHPQKPELGTRELPFSRELWIERDDFMEQPPKGFHRLVPGGEVRLRFVGIVRCFEFRRGEDGRVNEIHCALDAESRPGLPGADRKVKGTIHWVSAKHAMPAEVRLYDRLFRVPDPDAGDADYRASLNPDSKRVVPQAWLEPALGEALPEQSFQFERLGYFIADRRDHSAEHPVFNRSATLRDSWKR